MRASRLLQILLLLQNRGRLTSTQLAAELEMTPRTILRDVDAMTEAGLPIIVFQGNQGGIELGFNYRTRLTGLDREEAEALGVILGTRNAALGMDQAAQRAQAKLVESLPDKVRDTVQRSVAEPRALCQSAPRPARSNGCGVALCESYAVIYRRNGLAADRRPVFVCQSCTDAASTS